MVSTKEEIVIDIKKLGVISIDRHQVGTNNSYHNIIISAWKNGKRPLTNYMWEEVFKNDYGGLRRTMGNGLRDFTGSIVVFDKDSDEFGKQLADGWSKGFPFLVDGINIEELNDNSSILVPRRRILVKWLPETDGCDDERLIEETDEETRLPVRLSRMTTGTYGRAKCAIERKGTKVIIRGGLYTVGDAAYDISIRYGVKHHCPYIGARLYRSL